MDPRPPFDDWAPLRLDDAVDLFEGAPFRWWVSGGHALDLHVGRSWRPHADLDIGVLRQESDAVFTWLDGWDLWLAIRGALTPWRGEPLETRRAANNVWGRSSRISSWQIDLTIGSGDAVQWIYRRDPTIRREWVATVLRTATGIPYLAPEIQLLFKGKSPRPKDDLYARTVIPLLDADQRTFLAGHLDPDHPWRRLLD